MMFPSLGETSRPQAVCRARHGFVEDPGHGVESIRVVYDDHGGERVLLM